MTALNKPILPLLALMFVVVFEKSGLGTGGTLVFNETDPRATKMYLQPGRFVPAGNVKMLAAELPQLPVADPYSIVQLLISTAVPPLL